MALSLAVGGLQVLTMFILYDIKNELRRLERKIDGHIHDHVTGAFSSV